MEFVISQNELIEIGRKLKDTLIDHKEKYLRNTMVPRGWLDDEIDANTQFISVGVIDGEQLKIKSPGFSNGYKIVEPEDILSSVFNPFFFDDEKTHVYMNSYLPNDDHEFNEQHESYDEWFGDDYSGHITHHFDIYTCKCNIDNGEYGWMLLPMYGNKYWVIYYCS